MTCGFLWASTGATGPLEIYFGEVIGLRLNKNKTGKTSSKLGSTIKKNMSLELTVNAQ